MWRIGIPIILLFMVFLSFSELSKVFGSCMALYIFFHILGFVEWLVSMYMFLEEDLKKLEINKFVVSLSIAIHFFFFLFIMPYNIKELPLLPFIKGIGRLFAGGLTLNGIYCLLSRKKNKDMTKFLLLNYSTIELISLFLSIHIIGSLSIIFS